MTSPCGNLKGAGIRILARVPAAVRAGTVDDLTRELEQAGYVVVSTEAEWPVGQRRRVWHRHVLLLHRMPMTPTCAHWIRELADASPRAHGVIVLEREPDHVEEARPHFAPPLRAMPTLPASRGVPACAPHETFPWGAPAESTMRREWLRAALARHVRRGDWASAVAAFGRLVEGAEPADRAATRGLVSLGRNLLRHIDGLSLRSHVAASLAHVWTDLGEIELGVATLAGIDVECVLVGCKVPPWIRDRQMELACWQGRWDDLARLASEQPESVWLQVADVLRGRSDVCGPFGVGRARWEDALQYVALRRAGNECDADAWFKACERRGRGPLAQVLWRWATRDHAARQAADVTTELDRLGLDGIRLWEWGRSDMQVWTGVSALWRAVEEAVDALSALEQGCRWVQEYTGVDAVEVAGPVPGQVLARTPGRTPGGGERVVQGGAWTAPVRYGGAVIGSVVLSGVPRAVDEAQAVATALATVCAPALRARLDELLVSQAGSTLSGELLGISPGMVSLRQQAARAAMSAYPVLIEGESGTGKELVARAIHRISPRRDRRWAALNCAALTDELLESELFGHARGAFTGAVGARTGLLEDAEGGTLFLDEVGELSLRAQAKLLRVLQEREVRRVGENRSRKVDVRIVAATNRGLNDFVGRGAYRQDLLFRLAVIRLAVPPLRARLEDVPMLAHTFWRAAAAHVSTRAVLGPDAVAALCRHSWPGNVRELQNVIAALAVAGPSRGRITGGAVAAVLGHQKGVVAAGPSVSLSDARRSAERRAIGIALARHGGRRTAAARELGVSRQGLAKLMARLQIEEEGSGYHRPA